MPDLTQANLRPYLESLLGQPVTSLGLAPLGHPPHEEAIKGYGYGAPIDVACLTMNYLFFSLQRTRIRARWAAVTRPMG